MKSQFGLFNLVKNKFGPFGPVGCSLRKPLYEGFTVSVYWSGVILNSLSAGVCLS